MIVVYALLTIIGLSMIIGSPAVEDWPWLVIGCLAIIVGFIGCVVTT
jgi:hypothetical protein